MNLERIALLCRFMENLVDPNFTMSRFTHACGTPACALGWACTVPALQDAGLDMKRLTGLALHDNPGDASEMTREVFGDVYLELFANTGHELIATPQQWAAHCRKFLAAHGYKEKAVSSDDEFKSFMKRVLCGLKLETGTIGKVLGL